MPNATRRPLHWDHGFSAWVNGYLREPDGSILTPSALADRWGFDPETVIGWIDGSARPQRRNCYRLAMLTGEDADRVLALAGYGPDAERRRAGPSGSITVEARELAARVAAAIAPVTGRDPFGDLPPGTLRPVEQDGRPLWLAVITESDLAPEAGAGDLALIDRADLWIRPGILIALLGDDRRLFVRRCVAADGGVNLVDAEGRIWLPDGAILLGRVVALTRFT